jgi:hypothetical protein
MSCTPQQHTAVLGLLDLVQVRDLPMLTRLSSAGTENYCQNYTVANMEHRTPHISAQTSQQLGDSLQSS